MNVRFTSCTARIVGAALCGLLTLPLFADLRIGDDRLTVLEALGQPQGRIEMGEFERLFYERGEVQLREGLVIRIELISEAAAEARRERQARESESRRERGEAVKAERLADSDFRTRPAAERYAFWRDFRREFPEVDVFVQYTDAKAAAEADAERQRTADRLANVERRVADAEFRAQQAENTARTLNTPTRVQYVTPWPVIHHAHRQRQPYRHPPFVHHPRPQPQTPQPGTRVRVQPNSDAFSSSIGISTAEPLSGFSLGY
ncbi:MAG: hypothetical protein JJU05_01175 [Verrucomicrobia bacterium]|nr:hypothetical protein [Verrucomicrobiota bacterium]MCH8525905.1 hypothetical protein [Kiritimatiellia bacterium]